MWRHLGCMKGCKSSGHALRRHFQARLCYKTEQSFLSKLPGWVLTEFFVSALPGAGAYVITRCSGTNRQAEITAALPHMKRGCSADRWVFSQSLGKLLLFFCHGAHGTRSRNSTFCAGEVILQKLHFLQCSHWGRGAAFPAAPYLDHIRRIKGIFTLHSVQLFF